ncbi:MAG TPA: lipid-A-disaccharide synthase [Acidobacteriota bacterium]
MKALIVAGEASGDLYGGELASLLRLRLPAIDLGGMGGDRMAASGVDLLYHHRDVSVVGVFEVFQKLAHLSSAYYRIRRWVLQNKPQFAVLIDFPDFNFRIARFLRKHRIKVFYFVSPQVWAWRKNRIHTLRNLIELMICILPFEKNLYDEAGVEALYVGHPLVEVVRREAAGQRPFPRNSRPLLGLMPGSREVEVARHLPLLIDTIGRIRERVDVDAVLIWAPWLKTESFMIPSDLRTQKTDRYAAMQACDLLLVASGTSTLEAAILGVPLFIVYRVSPLSWKLGKYLVRVPYYGLINWIAQKKVIPEYIQDAMNPAQLAADAISILQDDSSRSRMKEELSGIVQKLGSSGAMERTTEAIIGRIN